MLLTQKYRSTNFEEVIGQDAAVSLLRSMVIRNKYPKSIFLYGGHGLGKTTLARILSRAALCTHRSPTGSPCNQCPNCLDHLSGTSPGYLELDSASVGNVQDIRSLKEELYYIPVGVSKRIVTLDEAHVISPAAQAALLKILEEGPPNLVFVFATTHPDKVLNTIRSRSFNIPLSDVSPSLMQKHLQRITLLEGIHAEPDALLKIAHTAQGHVRDAVMSLDQAALLGPVTLDSVQRTLSLSLDPLVMQLLISIRTSTLNDAEERLSHIYQASQPQKILQSLLHVTSILVRRYHKVPIVLPPDEEKYIQQLLTLFDNQTPTLVRSVIDRSFQAQFNSFDSLFLACAHLYNLFNKQTQHQGERTYTDLRQQARKNRATNVPDLISDDDLSKINQLFQPTGEP